jgi:SSS family solute:Na+ symporter
MEPWVVATSLIFLYLIGTLVIGWVANRRMSSDAEDFLLYGRRAGPIVLYLTVVATYHSAFAFLGSGGFFYTHGVGFWVAGCWTILVGAITYTLGVRIWFVGKTFGYVTPADLLGDFYNSEAVRVVAAVVSVVFTLLYIQVQAQGLGYILAVASGDRVPFAFGTGVLLVVAATYLMAGGLRAVYWTDVLQGIWMYVAVWVGAIVLTVRLFGSPWALWRQVAEQRPDLLTLPGPQDFFGPGMWFGMTIVLSFGVVLQPHMLIRYFSADSARTVKLLGATTPIYLASLYIPAAFVGLAGALVMPGLEVPDRIFPLLLFEYAPAWLTGLILAGATAAAMSTLDSILHSNMTVLTRDVYQRYVNPDADEARVVMMGRVIIVALLLVAFVLSISSSDFLVVIVTMSAAGALQLMPGICAVCLPSPRPLTANGVLAGVFAGMATLYVTTIMTPHPLGIHGGIWALTANWSTAWVVTRFSTAPDAARVARIHGALEDFIYGADKTA